MAKQQYRVSTDSNGTSNFGYAYLAIINPSGSGKKMTLRSLEVALHSVMNTTTAIGATSCTLYRCSGPLDGEDMVENAVANDSSVAIPATCKVRRNSMTNGSATVLNRIDAARRGGAVSNQNRLLFGSPMTIGKRGRRPLGGLGNGASGGYNSEAITLRQNEGVALIVDPKTETSTNPMRVNVVASANGKTITWDFNANTYPGLALFSLENTGTDPVKLLAWSIMDLGTTDTPTLRVVPIGQMYSPDVNDLSKQNVGVMKMDSTYPTFPGKVYTDIGFIPQGVPEVEISPASTGTPQGMNYLHTRDFWGPMYRNMLVEACHMKGVGSGIPDAFGMSYSHHGCDLLGRRAGITLNEGEGIAIVNSAETAVGVQAAYGAWQPMTFSAQVDVDQKFQPSVTFTGLPEGTEIRIRQGSYTLSTQQDVSGGQYTYQYDATDASARVSFTLPGYVIDPIDITLSLTVSVIPVTWAPDPSYSAT